MTRSAFTVLSALTVPCDKAAGGCGATIGKRCTSKRGLEMAHCHPSRRKAADAQRTREVNLEASAPSWNLDEETMKREANKRPYMMNSMDPRPTPLPWPPGVKSLFDPTRKLECNAELFDPDPPAYLPMREPLPPRVPDLNPDDEYRAACAESVNVVPFFPEGAKIAIAVACLEATNRRPTSLRVEWNAEHATVVAHVGGISEASLDDVMGHAMASFPVGIGVDIRIENP
mgnify:CR=1 FL=1